MKINVKNTLIYFIFNFSMLVIITGMLKTLFFGLSLYKIFYAINVFFAFLDILLCLFYIISLKKINKSIFSINNLVFFMLVYELVVSILNNSIHFPNGIVNIMLWPLLLIVFYNISKNESDKLKFIGKKISKVYIFALIISGFLITMHLSGRGNSGQAIFPTYFCLSLLPLIFLFESSNKFKNFFLFFSVILMIITTKRTGTLLAVAGMILYSLADSHIRSEFAERMKRYFRFVLVGIIVIICSLIYINTHNVAIIERFSNLSEDGGSGRTEIWEFVYNEYKNSGIEKKVFGHGSENVYYELMPGGYNRYAHNSYIEYLYDYGIVGVTLLIIFNFYLLISCMKFLKHKNVNAAILVYIVTINIFLSLFSYYYEQSYIILPVSIALGCVLGREKSKCISI